MNSLDRALAHLERELCLQPIPRALFSSGVVEGYPVPVEPEALLVPGSGALRGGELLPDALPVAGDGEGGCLAIRFDGRGAPREAIAWRGDGAWHPRDVPALPSDVARLRGRAEAALSNGLTALAANGGGAALVQNLGVQRETFSDWILDARLVPEQFRPALRRLTGEADAALFGQDWEGAAASALRAAALRPELAWPGAVLGWFEEGRGHDAAAARAWRAALLAFTPTLDFAARFARPGESAARVLADAAARTGGDAADAARDPALAAARRGPGAVRAFHLAECDRLRAAGRPAEAWDAALRAGWMRLRPIDMDDVLGRLGDAADAAGSTARAALARLHLRALVASRRG